MPQPDASPTISVADALKIVDICSQGLFGIFRFSLSVVTAVLGLLISLYKDLAGIEFGVRVLLCISATVVFATLWAAMARSKHRLEAAIGLTRITLSPITLQESKFVDRFTIPVNLSEHVMGIFIGLLWCVVLWPEIRRLL